jgi:hypothetical protein
MCCSNARRACSDFMRDSSATRRSRSYSVRVEVPIFLLDLHDRSCEFLRGCRILLCEPLFIFAIHERVSHALNLWNRNLISLSTPFNAV